MPSPSKAQYLDAKVHTASQPQLHLMLLDGALCFGRQAKEAWADSAEPESVDPMMVRMVNIVEALILGAAEGSDDSSKQLEEQYAFVYRELTACRINQDLSKLDSCLQLLEYQRETWKLACDKLAAEAPATSRSANLPGMHTSMSPAGSLSIEA